MLYVEIGEVGDFQLAVEQRVEETDQQVLVQLRAEQLLNKG